MSGYYIHKQGFKNINEMMLGTASTTGMIQNLIESGFTLVFPTDINLLTPTKGNYEYTILGNSTTKNRWCAILEYTEDSLYTTEPWCIKFEWDINNTNSDASSWTDGILDVIVATPLQFDYNTGMHTSFKSHYMPVQKRQIISGDQTKTDPAYEYKEVLGILGTSFRSKECIITSPNLITSGISSSIDVTASNKTSLVRSSAQPFGDTTVVTNYREITADVLNSYINIDPNAVIKFSINSADTGNATSNVGDVKAYQVSYKTPWSTSNSNRIAKSTLISYKSNVYQNITSGDLVLNVHQPQFLTTDNVLSNGITLGYASGNAFIPRIITNGIAFKCTNPNGISNFKIPTVVPGSPTPLRFTYATQAFYLNNALLTIPVGTWWGVPAEIDSSTIITAENAATYKVTYIAEKSDGITEKTAQYFGLQVDTSITYVPDTNELTPESAVLYGLQHVPSYAKTYVYVPNTDNLYEVSYAKDPNLGPTSSSVTPSTTSFTIPEELGFYGYKYVGKYSEFKAATSGGSSSYFDLFEAQDSAGYGDDIVKPGDISFPAILRNRNTTSKMFFNRETLGLYEGAAYPLSFTASITNRGIALCVYEETSDDVGNRNSWFVIQRPADHSTGDYDGKLKDQTQTFVSGLHPVHCLYSIMSKQQNKPWIYEDMRRATVDVGYAVKIVTDTSNVDTLDFKQTGNYTVYIPSPQTVHVNRFIVRESDISAPYPTPIYQKSVFGPNMDYSTGGFPFGTPADRHTPDYNAVINTKQQVAVSEGNKYVITFPNGLNTARFSYTHELDMLAYTSADVISEGAEISITVYGESEPRVYRAMHANGPNNTGMRILLLKSGGGIS